MYADPFTLVVSAVDHDFHRIRSEGNAAFYAHASNDSTTARDMRVLHATGAKNLAEPSIRAKRHVLTFGRTEYLSTVPRSDRATVGLTIVDPNVSLISRTELNELLNYVTAFLGTTDNVDKLLRGEL